MKTLKFNKSSWHYQIADFGGFDRWKSQDICQYSRSFAAGVLKTLFLLSLFAVVSFFAAELIIGTIFSLVYWQFMLSIPAQVLAIVIFVFTSGCSIFVGADRLASYLRNKHRSAVAKPDGFIKNAYHSWKDKYCARVEITYDV